MANILLLKYRGRQALDSVPGGATVGVGLDVANDLKNGKNIKDIANDR